MFREKIVSNKYAALVEKLNEWINIGNEGAAIVLEINPVDYLLSPIAHLVEQNNARLLHVLSYSDEETSTRIVILKIDLEDASAVLRSLERFNYTVLACLQKQAVNNETLQNRFGELMYYLEM